MKRLITTGLTALAALLLLTNCNNENRQEPTTVAADTTESTVQPIINTIVTTPENIAVAVFKVKSYEGWKVVFDQHDSIRRANGLLPYVVGRGLLDTSMVLAAFKVSDTAKAKAFMGGNEIKKLQQKAGIVGKPEADILTAVWQDTANIGSTPRSMTMLTVKDFNEWRNAFEEGKQLRESNGIVTRVIGHSMSANNKVYVVTALTDTAAAFAFQKFDTIRVRMEKSGVIGQAKRFAFRIVQR